MRGMVDGKIVTQCYGCGQVVGCDVSKDGQGLIPKGHVKEDGYVCEKSGLLLITRKEEKKDN
jgi:ssDNA-binding Zn-finger/Zn-ribbon topoisomerase 1